MAEQEAWKQLYDYWLSKHVRGRPPTRQEIDPPVEVPRLIANMMLVENIDGDSASGTQPLCFIDGSTHDMRIGYYRDTYLRTADGWRLKTRAMTFIRRSGVHDSGRPHAIGRPTP